MTVTAYTDLVYVGIGKQSVQGTGVVPAKFGKVVQAAFFPSQKISDFRNGNAVDIAFSLKETFHYAGTVKLMMFADEFAAFLTYVMGQDTKTGSSDPYTHTIVLLDTIPWLSVEVSYGANQIIDRVIDCKITRMLIEWDVGQPLYVTLDLLGSSVAVQGSPATVSFTDASEQGPMMMYHAAFTLTGPSDATTLQGQLQKGSIEIQRNIMPVYGPGLIYPITLKEQGRQINAKFTALFSGPAVYDLTHYGASNATGVANGLGTGSLVVAITPQATGGNIAATFSGTSVTVTAHGLAVGNGIYFTNSGGALPSPLAASTIYYIVQVLDANTFQIALTPGGAAISFTGGTGTNTCFRPERSSTLTIGNATWQMAKPTPTNGSANTEMIDLQLVGFRSGATLPISAVCKNSISTGY